MHIIRHGNHEQIGLAIISGALSSTYHSKCTTGTRIPHTTLAFHGIILFISVKLHEYHTLFTVIFITILSLPGFTDKTGVQAGIPVGQPSTAITGILFPLPVYETPTGSLPPVHTGSLPGSRG